MVRPCVARGFRRAVGCAVLHQCIRPQFGACARPPWISARLRSHYRPSLKWAIWGTSVRKRREDRSSISSHPLADLGGKQNVVLRHRLLLIGPVPLFVPGGRSFVPACGSPGRRAEEPSSLAVALTSPLARRFPPCQ